MSTSRERSLLGRVSGAAAHEEAAALIAADVRLHRASAAAHHAEVLAAVEVLRLRLDLVQRLRAPVLEAGAVGHLHQGEGRPHHVQAGGREDEPCIGLF